MDNDFRKNRIESPAKLKSKQFALRIIKMYKYLVNVQKEYVISKQILRSGTSIGANLAEAECAVSRKDFISKLYVALKECSESRYWLELLVESNYIGRKAFDSIYSDCQELMKILSASTITLKRNEREED